MMGGNLCFDNCTPEGRLFLIAGSHMAALLSCSRVRRQWLCREGMQGQIFDLCSCECAFDLRCECDLDIEVCRFCASNITYFPEENPSMFGEEVPGEFDDSGDVNFVSRNVEELKCHAHARE